LKRTNGLHLRYGLFHRSIHPQGWVPIETVSVAVPSSGRSSTVAFTPKGGCPLKLIHRYMGSLTDRSIHPQGWVPIETQRRYSPV